MCAPAVLRKGTPFTPINWRSAQQTHPLQKSHRPAGKVEQKVQLFHRSELHLPNYRDLSRKKHLDETSSWWEALSLVVALASGLPHARNWWSRARSTPTEL